MLMLGTGPSAIAARFASGALPAAPIAAPTFTRFVIEGDSITSGSPQQTTNHDGFYSYSWANGQTGITAHVTAQGSRTVGGAAYDGNLADEGGPVGNTLWAQRNADLALTPQLVTAMIGVNDLSSTGISVPTYIQRLKDWGAAIKAGGAKIAYAPPTPTEVRAGNGQASHDFFMAKWNTLWTTHNVRNPANWSQWADYYIPMGEHPDLLLGNHTSDGIHPSGPATNPATGQGKLLAVFSAAMATLRDPTRVSAPGPYESVWDAFGPFTDLAAGTTITRRVILSGLAWAGRSESVVVTGAGNPSVKTNGKTAPGYAYNGDVIDLALTLSSAYETDRSIQLTIGGETRTLTFRTAANVTPVAYVHGDVTGQAEGGTSLTLSNLAFATGRAVVMVATGNTALASDAVKLDGVALTRRHRQATDYTGCIELWDGPVAAGSNHTLAIAYPGWRGNRLVSYGTVTNGAFLTAAGNAPANQSPPHETPSVTVPANGIAVAGLLEYAGGASTPPATVNNGTSFVDEGQLSFQSEVNGIAVSTRTTSGTASYNFVFGTFARVIAVYGVARDEPVSFASSRPAYPGSPSVATAARRTRHALVDAHVHIGCRRRLHGGACAGQREWCRQHAPHPCHKR